MTEVQTAKKGAMSMQNNNAPPAGLAQRIFISDLLPGDILLHRPAWQHVFRRKISKQTNSPYTHASIYLGDGLIAETKLPRIRVGHLYYSWNSYQYIGVLRNQIPFDGLRPKILRCFVDGVRKNSPWYDLSGIKSFERRREFFRSYHLDTIQKDYGKFKSFSQFERRQYFCSSLIVACYAVTDIIGQTAQVAYPPDAFSPGDLHRDATFGWLLGYLFPGNGIVPPCDPLLILPHWQDSTFKSVRWW